MLNIKRCAIIGILSLASCSSFRSDLSPGRLVLGKTTRLEAEVSYASPHHVDTVAGPGITSPTCLYTYGFRNTSAPDVFRGVWKVPQQNLVLEFRNDTLNGYLSNNSTDEPGTGFNKRLRWRIAIGKTTQAEVLTLLGEPAGRYLLPTSLFDAPILARLRHVMPAKAKEAWCYYYAYPFYREGYHERFEYYRFLAVYFNAAGGVIDKFFGESDKNEPSVTRIFVQ